MPTLHSVTENTKTLLKFGGIFVLIIIFISLIFQGGIFLKEYFFPAPITPPAAEFGKLPKVIFPQSLPQDGLTFELDTVSGDFPTFSTQSGKTRDRVNVFKTFSPAFSLLDLQNAKATVAEIGFLGNEVSLGNNIYQWSTTQEGLERSIEMNIVNKNFTFASSFRTNQQILSPVTVFTPQAAQTSSNNFLKSMSLLPTDIDESKTRLERLRIQDSKLIPTETQQDTQIIRVSYFQKDIDSLKLFYSNPPYSTLDFFVGSGGKSAPPQVVQATFHHHVFTAQNSEYPLKPVQTAFKELQDGKGYIGANFVKDTHIKIKDILLGYYVSEEPQEYLIPIYVFKGVQDEFYAYVVALPDEWFDSQSKTTEK